MTQKRAFRGRSGRIYKESHGISVSAIRWRGPQARDVGAVALLRADQARRLARHTPTSCELEAGFTPFGVEIRYLPYKMHRSTSTLRQVLHPELARMR